MSTFQDVLNIAKQIAEIAVSIVRQKNSLRVADGLMAALPFMNFQQNIAFGHLKQLRAMNVSWPDIKTYVTGQARDLTSSDGRFKLYPVENLIDEWRVGLKNI